MRDEHAPGIEAERMHVETPESVAFAYELAGLGSRGLALGLDMLMIGLLMLAQAAVGGAIIGLLVLVDVPGSRVQEIAVWVLGALILAWFATYWGYFIYGEVVRNGRTWGKRRLGIRVVRDDGSRVATLESVIRNLLRIVDILPGNYAIGMVSVLLTKRNKRLGDLAAGTVVVRDTGEVPLTFDAVVEEPAVGLARDFLRRRADLTEPARMQVGVAVLRAFGEEPGAEWDEPTLAGRIADLSGYREAGGAETPAAGPDAI